MSFSDEKRVLDKHDFTCEDILFVAHGKAGKAMHEKHVVAGIHEMKRCQNLAILVDTRRKGGKAGKAMLSRALSRTSAA